MDAFQINGTTFVVILNYFHDVNHKQPGVKVFKMTESGLTSYQDIPINRPIKSRYFEMDGQHFLAIAVNHDAATGMYSTNSKVYKWKDNKFVLFQKIPTIGASDIKYFTIDKYKFLCVANNFDGRTTVIPSSIQKWNGNRFVLYQNILTAGASACTAFSINGQHFVSFAQTSSNNGVLIKLPVLRFSGFKTGFAMFQNLASFIAADVTYFRIRDNHFLVLANRVSQGKYNVLSSIYKWNGAGFVVFQNINTFGATGAQPFEINGETYLGISNSYNDFTRSNVVHSAVYKATGSVFAIYQHVPSTGAKGIDFFNYKGSTYLVMANNRNGNFLNLMSYLYKLK